LTEEDLLREIEELKKKKEALLARKNE